MYEFVLTRNMHERLDIRDGVHTGAVYMLYRYLQSTDTVCVDIQSLVNLHKVYTW